MKYCNIKPSKVAQVVRIAIYVWEVSSLNLYHDYPDWRFLWFPSVTPDECLGNILKWTWPLLPQSLHVHWYTGDTLFLYWHACCYDVSGAWAIAMYRRACARVPLPHHSVKWHQAAHAHVIFWKLLAVRRRNRLVLEVCWEVKNSSEPSVPPI
jgi:hypothetical protein